MGFASTHYRSIVFIAYASAFITVAFMCCGCQQKMADQPSYKPLQPSEFFPDGREARPVVPHTIARGQLRVNRAFFTGRVQQPHTANTNSPNDQAATPAADVTGTKSVPAGRASDTLSTDFTDDAAFVPQFPVTISEPMIQHGANRYMIYCVVCHDPQGTGHGRIIERGYTPPPSFHIDRLRDAPLGRLFAVITEGYGSMPSYADQIPPADRWTIVAYVRALQLSQHFPRSDLTPEMREALSKSVALNPASGNSAAANARTP